MKSIFSTGVLVVAFGLLTASTAKAQTGACPTGPLTPSVNPSGWVCITPAADYTSTHTGPDGTTQVPTVVRMDLLLFGPTVTDTATGTPTQTINIGKPTRNAEGAVWVQRTELAALPVGQTYKARAVAIGQPLTAGGAAQVSARSPESNPFMRLAPAPAPLAPTAIRVPE